MITTLKSNRLWRLGAAAALVLTTCSASAVTLEDLWSGKAHLREVGELNWGSAPAAGLPPEQAGWFVAAGGRWYAFNRATLTAPVSYCHQDHTRIVVRTSADRGRTWSAPVSAIEPGASPHGDGCSILDGSSYYDPAAKTWHMLVQCMDRNEAGGWALCHYTRSAPSPAGRFIADPANPVVRGGQLWSRICSGSGKACPTSTRDEGTPEILDRRGARFFVGIHGYDYASKTSYRGVVATTDFRHWQTSGAGLPGDAVLGPKDCGVWLKGCTGVGEATTLLGPKNTYVAVETMDKGLPCVPNQKWVFQLLRTPRGPWPRSGSGEWQHFSAHPFLTASHPDRGTLCALQYARWLADGADLYLIYEDWGPNRAYVHRRLLKLVSGGGEPVQIALNS